MKVTKELSGKKNVPTGATDDVATMLMDMFKGDGPAAAGSNNKGSAIFAQARGLSSDLQLQLMAGRPTPNVSWH